MKKIFFALLLIVSFSCSQRIDATPDPLDKTLLILEAIRDGKISRVQNEYLGIENHPENKKVIAAIGTKIRQNFDKYGFPDEQQISVSDRAKWPISSSYCSEFNGNIVQVISTTTELGTGGPLVKMQFAIVRSEARLLNLSISNL